MYKVLGVAVQQTILNPDRVDIERVEKSTFCKKDKAHFNHLY